MNLMASRTSAVMGKPDRVLHASAPDLVLFGQPVHQVVGGTGAIGTHQQLLAIPSGDLGDRLTQDLDVVGGGVGAGVPGPQLDREHLGGVVTPHPERVEAERLLERDVSLFLLTVCGDQRGVDVEHDHIAEVGVGDLRGRHPAGKIRKLDPDVAADLRPRPGHPFHRGRGQLVQSTPHRRRRCHRSQHARLVPQHVDIGDRLTTSASITATSTSTRPRSWTGVNDRLRRTLDSSPVSPTRSANIRFATLPACATTPLPSPVTDKPADHEVRFIYRMPSCSGIL